jgi:hypothetical protein
VNLLSIATAIRAAWDALFVSRHTLWLEAENARLRAQVGKLEMDIQNSRLPLLAAPAHKQDFKKIPQQVGGQVFWDADVRAAKRAELFADEKEPETVAQEN